MEWRARGAAFALEKSYSIHLESITSTWSRRKPLLPALLGAQILFLRKSDHTSLLVAVHSPKLPICKQNVIFIIILKNFRIVTVQRAIQLPAFSLFLGHRQNTPAMN